MKGVYWVIVISLTVIVLSVFLLFFYQEQSAPPKVTQITQQQPPVNITYTNIENVLPNFQLIKELPEDAKIELKFYNFNAGEKSIEKTYSITKGSLKEGPLSDADFTVFVHSKYLGEMTNQNFCDVMKKANDAGDLGVETDKSAATLLWKYMSVSEYKSCFGF